MTAPISYARYRDVGTRRVPLVGPRHAWLTMTCVVLLSVMLSGCAGSSTSASRYTLPAAGQGVQYSTPASRTLILEPIRVAPYLDSDGIVMQLSDIEIHQASNHLWAEDLNRQLERSLRHHLSLALPEVRVLRENRGADAEQSLSVRLDVENFQGRHDGMAVVSGQWQLRDPSGRLLSLQHFDIERALDADGYPALVRSLGSAWQTVAEQLADEIANQPSL
ncbi:PqiC family protein [Halomonas sp. WWR20]